jgi:hypothetical protein
MRLAAALLVTTMSCFLAHAKSDSDEDQSRKAAEAWLALVDGQKYEQSWKETSIQFRSEVSEEQWTAALKNSRDPPGSMVARKQARVDFTKTLRGAPDGNYVIFHFTTDFQNKQHVTERITLVEEDGTWRVMAYATH